MSRATKGSGAAPTTSISPSLDSSFVRIFRTMAESSTMSTLILGRAEVTCKLSTGIWRPFRALQKKAHLQKDMDAVHGKGQRAALTGEQFHIGAGNDRSQGRR